MQGDKSTCLPCQTIVSLPRTAALDFRRTAALDFPRTVRCLHDYVSKTYNKLRNITTNSTNRAR